MKATPPILGFSFDPTVCQECGHVHEKHSPIGGKCANLECGSRELKTDIERADWSEQALGMIRMHNKGNFLLGDWIAYGLDNFGQSYLEAQHICGLQSQTLMNLVWVCRKVALSRRREMPMTFTHHEAVAGLKPTEQIHFLGLAIEKNFSCADLRASIRQALRAPAVAELPAAENSGLTSWFADGVRLLRNQDPKTWTPARRAAFRAQWDRLATAAAPFLI